MFICTCILCPQPPALITISVLILTSYSILDTRSERGDGWVVPDEYGNDLTQVGSVRPLHSLADALMTEIAPSDPSDTFDRWP